MMTKRIFSQFNILEQLSGVFVPNSYFALSNLVIILFPLQPQATAVRLKEICGTVEEEHGEDDEQDLGKAEERESSSGESVVSERKSPWRKLKKQTKDPTMSDSTSTTPPSALSVGKRRQIESNEISTVAEQRPAKKPMRSSASDSEQVNALAKASREDLLTPQRTVTDGHKAAAYAKWKQDRLQATHKNQGDAERMVR